MNRFSTTTKQREIATNLFREMKDCSEADVNFYMSYQAAISFPESLVKAELPKFRENVKHEINWDLYADTY